MISKALSLISIQFAEKIILLQCDIEHYDFLLDMNEEAIYRLFAGDAYLSFLQQVIRPKISLYINLRTTSSIGSTDSIKTKNAVGFPRP